MAPSSTTTVLVVVPPRPEPHGGFWSLGRSRAGKGVFFPSGQTEIEVTPEELAELQEEAAERFVPDSAEPGGKKRVPGFITIVELDPLTIAKRRAEAEAKAAKAAAAALEKAKAEAETRAAAAREAAAIAAAAEKDDPKKGGKK